MVYARGRSLLYRNGVPKGSVEWILKTARAPWVGRWRRQKCHQTPIKDHVLFEKETLGSPFEGVRSYMIVTAKSHDLPFRGLLLAPQQKMGGVGSKACLY